MPVSATIMFPASQGENRLFVAAKIAQTGLCLLMYLIICLLGPWFAVHLLVWSDMAPVDTGFIL